MLAPLLNLLAAVPNQTFYQPPRASTIAGEIDWLFDFVLWLTIFFATLILGAMAWFVIKYRAPAGTIPEKSPGHSTSLELTWTIIPLILVLMIFYWGFDGYMKLNVAPPLTGDAEEITVESYTWAWNFVYSNGAQSPVLYVPKNKPVKLILTSKDVIHAFYVPAFRLQKMNMPGRYNKLWFQTELPAGAEAAEMPDALKTQIAEGKFNADDVKGGVPFPLYCNMYCGQQHNQMLSWVVVMEEDAYRKRIADLTDPDIAFAGKSPAEKGKILAQQRGCVQCHSADGSAGTGPTWKDMYGEPVSFTDGTKLDAVDEDYIHESIYDPSKKIVQGFGNAMPSYRGSLSEKEVRYLIDYQKSISKHGGKSEGGSGAASQPGASSQPGAASQPASSSQPAGGIGSPGATQPPANGPAPGQAGSSVGATSQPAK